MKRKVIWLHCAYHRARHEKCARGICKVLEDIDADTTVYVCNNGTDDLGADGGWKVITGSNSAGEFGAWAELWYLCKDEICGDTVVVLSNDTFPFHQPFWLLSAFFKNKISNYSGFSPTVPMAAGVKEQFRFQEITEYLSTFFLVMNGSAARLVLPSITEKCVDVEVIRGGSGDVVRGADHAYVDYINNWLLGRSFYRWPNAAGESGVSSKFRTILEAKAGAVILEHSLSRRLTNNGGLLEDIFHSGIFGMAARYYYRLFFIAKFVAARYKKS